MTENPNPSLKITTSLFNGQNYLAWSQSLTIFLKSQGKMGYVDGRIQAPSTTDSGYDQWEITNSLIMGWLIHSMVLEISEGYLSMETAQDVWDAVAVTYSRKRNFSQAFELRRSIESSLQGEQTVLQYFTFLTNGWKCLDHLEDYKPICPADFVGYKKFIARERVFKFLGGLNVEYDPVRGRILGIDTLPSLQEVFAYVQNEESRRSAMMSPVSIDRSTLLSTPRDGLSLTLIPPSAAKESIFCDYCKKSRHTHETFSNTELEDALCQLLDRRSSTALSTASSSFARSGQDKVRIADGTVSSISGKGLVQSYFLSSPVSPSSFPGEPWCEVSPVLPIVDPVVLAPPSSTVLPMVEPVLAPPSSTGTIEPNVTKDKDGHVYVRDIERQQVNWIQGTTSTPPLPSPASDESLGNFESLESIDLDVPIAKRKVARSKDGIFVSQRKYVLDLLKETGMLGCKACATPLEPNQKLGDDEGGETVDKESY
ncbi:uncharacterized protein LOC114271885 [Camellia sinensis]|uniref:uncharacterized protein LOC114271885 n=1 Tax=Camellia sinensis TaxID=4442 RepID=UPI001036A638|nr:uncharacterized protein LOC114271885 [Camellia sinensis]